MPRKRQSGEGGLYYNAKRNLWIGVVDNGTTPDGRRKQVRVTSRSQSVARDKLREVMSQIKTDGSPLGNQTVAEWGAFWLSGIQQKKPGTFRTYRSMLNKWVFPVIGKRDVRDVRPSDLRRIYDNIIAAGNSDSTALKAHTVMSSMFEAARLDRLTAVNVAQGIQPPKAAKSRRGTLSPDETQRILETARALPDGTKWWVSLYAGIRQGERLGATIDSIDFRTGMFTVQWNLVAGSYNHGCGEQRPAHTAGRCPARKLIIPRGIEYRLLNGRNMLVPPKSGEPRTFPIPSKLLAMLEAHVAALDEMPNPYGLLWPSPGGTPFTPGEDQRQWRELLVEAGVDRPEATTHWARHTAISDMSAIGVADRVIGEMVGHKSPGVTGGYQHVSSADAVEAARRLEERRQLDK